MVLDGWQFIYAHLFQLLHAEQQVYELPVFKLYFDKQTAG